MGLTVHIRPLNGGAECVDLVGRLDMETAPLLQSRVRELLGRDCSKLLLNLSRLTFVDSAGLAALFSAQSLVAEAGGRLALAEPGTVVGRILDRTGVMQVIAVFDTEGKAAEWVAEEEATEEG